MATDAEKLATVATTDNTNSSAEENPSKNVDPTDQEKNHAAAVNSAAVGVKKDAEDSKAAASTVGPLSGNDGPVTDTQKKIRRAERFGMQIQLSEEEKRNSRAERFGLPVPSSAGDEETKRKARLARFAPYPKTDSLEEDKKKARALRFSGTPSGSMSQVNGKKATIADKVGRGD